MKVEIYVLIVLVAYFLLLIRGKKIYRIYQSVNNGYDTYSEAIVCARSKRQARKYHPDGEYDYETVFKNETEFGSWAKEEDVGVEYVGKASILTPKGVICSSFHAG